MYSVFFIIGASGAGKTTTLKHLEMAMPKGCILMHFDSIGVPSFQEMEEKYGSIEEWQRVKTDEWIRRFASCELVRTNVLFDAQVRPSFIQECCEKYEVPFEVVLFDASDEE